ncbi:unnamed protein product [Phytomonas sp. EM1]|nr:unnamed protein product [Phytomonas sp. EM1]|eukprot:CCW62962.1 unnamed protein product [Phytomonas sp. isolate EM1]
MDTNTEASYVTVNVHGTLRIPLHLDLLKNLDDPLLEGDILKESIKIAIGEYLGWFNHVDITLGSDAAPGVGPGRVTMKTCEAKISLEDLGIRIKAIQAAYDNVMRQVATLRDLLSLSQQEQQRLGKNVGEESEKGNKEGLNDDDAVGKVVGSHITWGILKERDAAMLALLESVLGSPAGIVDAAHQIEEESHSLRAMQDEKWERDALSSEKNPLEEGSWVRDETWQVHDDFNVMTENETTGKDYASMGYMPL